MLPLNDLRRLSFCRCRSIIGGFHDRQWCGNGCFEGSFSVLVDVGAPQVPVGHGEPGAPSTVGRLQAELQASEAASAGSCFLDVDVDPLARLTFGPDHRQTRDSHPLASPGFSHLLALEVERSQTRSANDRCRSCRFDPADVPGKRHVGCAENPIRAQAAVTRRSRIHGGQVYGL